jgi:hypothetical protein
LIRHHGVCASGLPVRIRAGSRRWSLLQEERMKSNIHEDFSGRQELRVSSDRGFGLVFTALFFLVAFWPLRKAGHIRLWAVVIAVLFLAAAFLRPAALHPLNRLWAQLSLLLSMIVNPVIMGLVFLAAITPLALVLRLLGKDLLRVRYDPGAASYWLQRQPPGPPPETMLQQF